MRGWRVIDLAEQVYLFGGVELGTKMAARIGFCFVCFVLHLHKKPHNFVALIS